jgi:hypothetical protein
MTDSTSGFAPAQIGRSGASGKIPWAVHLMAYEVYSEIFGKQDALVDRVGRNCRGGFGIAELIGFLYARNFPRDQWDKKFHEAIDGLESR